MNAIYSRLAKTYDRELRDDMQYTAYLKVPQLVINALGHKQASILDLGCGTGLSSLLFFEKGYEGDRHRRHQRNDPSSAKAAV